MKRIEETLTLALKGAISSLFDQEPTDNLVQIQHTRKDFEGDFTVVTFPLVRFSKQSPEKTGQLIGDYVVDLLEEV
ncbi:MAG: arginyl-tRNA synthetase, partial [Flavobacteriales bacterium]